ncbi:MAG: L-seryl-tRNA(Sec) selenium transferase [Pseudomonadota bacterium]
MHDILRRLPKVQSVLETELASQLIRIYGYQDVADAVRETLQATRDKLVANTHSAHGAITHQSVLAEIIPVLDAARAQTLRSAINATGIIIHTNLGRARLAPAAIDAMRAVAENYATLEFDLETGKRGSRHGHVEKLICHLTGAEAAIVVNNCAAAILVTLTALGSGKPIIASRGEMIEIGGSFRMPDIIAQSGADLKEVGTTNKTHLRDYASAIDGDTALLLKSHTSNYKVVGFTSTPTRADLAELAHREGTLLVEDLGSGVLVDLTPFGLPNEPVVKDVLAAGVDVVTFSGDKLLGGPQAGIIAGRKAAIERIKAHPLARAVRIDKLSLAALNATLELYRAPSNPFEQVPVLKSLAEPVELVQARAETLCDRLSGYAELDLAVLTSKAQAGGGSLPQQDLPSFAVSLAQNGASPDAIAAKLRAQDCPVIGRISNDRLLLDMRAVTDEDLPTLVTSIITALVK